MTVNELIGKMNLRVITLASPETEVTGGYVGDLLSWVMGRVGDNEAWITIMTNVNVVAVASLRDVSCVILAEGVTPDKSVVNLAEEKGVTLLSTNLSSYEVAVSLSELLK